MGLLDSLFGTNKARKEINASSALAQQQLNDARVRAEGALTSGAETGRADVNQWFDQAAGRLTGAQGGIRSDLNTGFDTARGDLTAGFQGAEDALAPWVQSGRGAQALYDRALGVGGADAQKSFYDNYASNDPYREYRDELANRQIQRQFASTGRTGAMSLAVGRASLERGSQDLQQYLSRLEQAGQRGQSASGQVAGYRAQGGQALAGNETARGSALANLGANFATNQANMDTNRGQALAGLSSGTGSSLANLIYGNGQQIASNSINQGNAIAQTRTAPMNNLVNLFGTGLKAYAGLK